MKITDSPPGIEGKQPMVRFMGEDDWVEMTWVRMNDVGIFVLQQGDLIVFYPWHRIDTIAFRDRERR